MKNKIKVLYFVDRMLRGGIQSLVIDWVSRFDKEKIQVDFLLLDDGKEYELEKTLEEIGCSVYKLNGIWINTPFDYIKYAKFLDDFFRKHHDYKVIHMHSSSKNFLILKYAKKYNIPIRIAHSHNIDFQTKNKIKKLAGNMFKILLKKYATNYFACSILAGEWLFGKNEILKDNVTIIHNAVDYNKFKFDKKVRKRIREELKINDNEILIGNVGRFTNQKNHEFLIDIFYEITKKKNNYKLILIGIGEKEDAIKTKVKKLGISEKVIFAGFRNDVNCIMQAMDIFLLPSLYEGLPVVGVEAQAAGLPCFMSKNVITDEVKITKKVRFLPLTESSSYWADEIINSDIKRNNPEKELKNAKYFIEDIIDELTKFYMQK